MITKFAVATLILAALVWTRAWSGPPLICHAIPIPGAASLPWQDQAGWNGMVPSYNTANLVGDTLGLLTPQAPVEVRMETLRRAAIYSSRDPVLADRLASRLFERKDWFDAGYFVEAVREAAVAYQMLHDPAQRAAWHLRSTPPFVASMIAQRTP